MAITPITGFLQLPQSLDAADPSIANLPLLTPTSGPTYSSGAGYAAGTSTAEAVGEDGQETKTIYGGKVHDIRVKRNRQIEMIIKAMAPEVMERFKRAA